MLWEEESGANPSSLRSDPPPTHIKPSQMCHQNQNQNGKLETNNQTLISRQSKCAIKIFKGKMQILVETRNFGQFRLFLLLIVQSQPILGDRWKGIHLKSFDAILLLTKMGIFHLIVHIKMPRGRSPKLPPLLKWVPQCLPYLLVGSPAS